MCVILVCPENIRPDRSTLDACHRANPHGAGVAWREDGVVRWFKGLEPGGLEPLIALPGEIVIGFRWAIWGEVTPKLCHPFPVTACATTRLSGHARAVLFHNGIRGDSRDPAADAPPRSPRRAVSDTRVAASLVDFCGMDVLDRLRRWSSLIETSPNSTATGARYGRADLYFAAGQPVRHSAFSSSPPPAANRTPGTAASDPRQTMKQQTTPMKRTYKLIASRGGAKSCSMTASKPTPRNARRELKNLLGLKSLSGIVYSITEVPVDLIREIVDTRIAELAGGDPLDIILPVDVTQSRSISRPSYATWPPCYKRRKNRLPSRPSIRLPSCRDPPPNLTGIW